MSAPPPVIKPPPSKRAKRSGAERVTTLDNPAFDADDVAAAKSHAKMSFRCPVTIDSVFAPPAPDQVCTFYESRNHGSKPWGHLSEPEQREWAESCHDNKTLMGFIVYATLFPKLLRNRIKLNAATYHWAHLDSSSAKGRLKLEQRRGAVSRLRRVGFARSLFRGLPHRIDPVADTSILVFMNMSVEEEDERFRFFTNREFSMIYSERGEVGSSSVYSSCSTALSLLWFATTVLARPCCLESIILPINVRERRRMEQRFGCPSHFFDGPIRSFQTTWGGVFAAIGTPHRSIDYTVIEFATSEKYVEGVHVSDAYAAFRATMTAPGDCASIAALVQSYRRSAKHGVESGAVVGALDVIRDRPAGAIGKIDGGVLGTILSTYGETACANVQAECVKLDGGASLFDDSVRSKLGEIMTHFDNQLWRARKKDKVERLIVANMDPAGINKKVEGGKMLDPTNPDSVAKMMGMLKSLSGQVWKPLRSLIGKALGASLESPGPFLQISESEAQTLAQFVRAASVTYADIANLCTLLLLSFSFQRSQVLREATVDEFVLVPDATRFKFSFKNRRFKTAASSGGNVAAPPVSHFVLTPDQSMIVKFIATAGHGLCCHGKATKPDNGRRRLFVNARGQGWNQKDISSRFKKIGIEWLSIENFGPHVCRSFWASSALNSGQVNSNNLEDFSSFLQVSSATLRNSYMAATANTAAHTLGNEVLGAVSNMACTGETTERANRPYGKKLCAKRNEFSADIQAYLAKHRGTTTSRKVFRALIRKRAASQLLEDEKWFRWENTFFGEGDERLFQRFVDKGKAD
ncbi:unnamed protein product [Ectocarpus sp. CCAP 1310/34]|nr:unnamed protein product [Ectocarpus sp. CCAP 1310/34]